MINKNLFFIILLLLSIAIGSCRRDHVAVKHVKPKNYDTPYEPKKDKQKKRTKKVKRLIIRQRN